MSQNPNDNTDEQTRIDQFNAGPDAESGQKWGDWPLGIPDEMVFDDASTAYEFAPHALGSELERYGITPEVVGRSPEEVNSEFLTNIYRYQFFCEYNYEAGPATQNDTPIAPIQFRTSVYTIGQPAEPLQAYLQEHISPRQKTLFDTGVYQDYFSNWAPFEGGYNENIEGPVSVGPDEVEAALGVPFFEVEIYDEDDNLRGEARGYFDPFTVIEHTTDDPPQEVEWGIGYRASRGTSGAYELKPIASEELRLRGTNKLVFLNGEYIGRMQAAKNRGVYLRTEYSRPPTEAGFEKWDRQRFIDADVFHPNAIAKGGKVWKVGETAETINLVATKPSDWDGIDASEVDATATGTAVHELALDPSQPTPFEVRADNKVYGALGRYRPPVEREILDETTFEVFDRASGTYIEK